MGLVVGIISSVVATIIYATALTLIVNLPAILQGASIWRSTGRGFDPDMPTYLALAAGVVWTLVLLPSVVSAVVIAFAARRAPEERRRTLGKRAGLIAGLAVALLSGVVPLVILGLVRNLDGARVGADTHIAWSIFAFSLSALAAGGITGLLAGRYMARWLSRREEAVRA